jgi:hypothetical protein
LLVQIPHSLLPGPSFGEPSSRRAQKTEEIYPLELLGSCWGKYDSPVVFHVDQHPTSLGRLIERYVESADN